MLRYNGFLDNNGFKLGQEIRYNSIYNSIGSGTITSFEDFSEQGIDYLLSYYGAGIISLIGIDYIILSEQNVSFSRIGEAGVWKYTFELININNIVK